MKRQPTTHEEQIKFLKKIEGQIRGIQRMIEEKRYCVDIIFQMRSIVGALHRVEDDIFKKHVENCVVSTLKGKSEAEKLKKINEVIDIISRFRKVV